MIRGMVARLRVVAMATAKSTTSGRSLCSSTHDMDHDPLWKRTVTGNDVEYQYEQLGVVSDSSPLSGRSARPVDGTEYKQVDASHWQFVDRLINHQIPDDVPDHPTPSGWIPPKHSLQSCPHPYFVERTKNHSFPLYLSHIAVNQAYKTKRRRFKTVIRHVHGDVFALEKDLREYLRPKVHDVVLQSQANEITRKVSFRNDHTELVSQFLIDKGF